MLPFLAPAWPGVCAPGCWCAPVPVWRWSSVAAPTAPARPPTWLPPCWPRWPSRPSRSGASSISAWPASTCGVPGSRNCPNPCSSRKTARWWSGTRGTAARCRCSRAACAPWRRRNWCGSGWPCWTAPAWLPWSRSWPGASRRACCSRAKASWTTVARCARCSTARSRKACIASGRLAMSISTCCPSSTSAPTWCWTAAAWARARRGAIPRPSPAWSSPACVACAARWCACTRPT
ncbi:hypothetical protein D3C87_1324920 [compost metagenome]